MNQTKHSVTFLLTGLFLINIITGCHRTPQPGVRDEPRPVAVKAMVVNKISLQVPVYASGILDAQNHLKLSFKIGGVIRTVSVTEGEHVRKGQELAALNLEEIAAREQQALLAYRKALRDYKRVNNLYRDSVATLEQLQNARTARDASYNNLKIARFNREHSVIRAPADGTILKKLAGEGEVIGAGHPVFLFASTEEAWVVGCSLADKDFIRFEYGDSAVLKFDVWPDKQFSGHITELASAADPVSGTFHLEVTLDTTPAKLVSGLFAEVMLFPDTLEEILTIPHKALASADRMKGKVFIVSNGVAHEKLITVERILDSLMIVSGSINPGDTLITEGWEDLDMNSKVVISKLVNAE